MLQKGQINIFFLFFCKFYVVLTWIFKIKHKIIERWHWDLSEVIVIKILSEYFILNYLISSLFVIFVCLHHFFLVLSISKKILLKKNIWFLQSIPNNIFLVFSLIHLKYFIALKFIRKIKLFQLKIHLSKAHYLLLFIIVY